MSLYSSIGQSFGRFAMAISSPWYTYNVPLSVHCKIANSLAVALRYSVVESLPKRDTDRATSWFCTW